MTDVALATSIPPGMTRPGPGGWNAGPDWRAACIASWPAPGWQVLSVNPGEEHAALGALPDGVTVIAAQPGVAQAFGRPGAWVADALAQALATGAPVVGLVNADIRLDLDMRRRAALVARAQDRVVACNRMDVSHAQQAEGPFYRYGYDLVLMPRAIAQRIDMRGFALGVPWWDYWILLDALLQGIAVDVVQCVGVRHLWHQTAWRRSAWLAALHALMAHLQPRRDAMSVLAMGGIAEAMADLLTAVAADPEAGYPLADLVVTAGTRFGIELVRLAERSAWTLD
ncbi:hypothetical protein KPL78_12660 [Roseomonas sp. HJA6]|uniref:Glycosyl transferase family 2 n=1 Tax=Roseomonas alba TaxID=2846776 RepID=A0ABS7A8U2_9PROT|nr:hypothetical protein [Neoroseomonas alba]MBW6398707.1 hypothetical protein [Neoroseomonas alba]